jgi:hypothetical protein
MQKKIFLLLPVFILTGCGPVVVTGMKATAGAETAVKDSIPTVLHIHVMDTKGKPVANAKVTVGWSWYRMRDWGDWNASPQGNSKTGVANENGDYTFVGFTKGQVGASASKDGYYSGTSDDSQKIILRKKQNPILMYAKNAWVDLPTGNGDFGYDLFAGDLVAPYGTGKHPDFIFRVCTTNLVWRDRQFKRLQADIVFPSSEDGIQTVFIPSFEASPSSAYRFPFLAPESGYQRSLKDANGNTETLFNEYAHQPQIRNKAGKLPVWYRDDSKLPHRWYWTDSYHLILSRDRVWMEEVNYFFKIRSDSGHACYGIIRGILRADYRGGDIPSVEFEYYINPDGTPNIEFDPAHNLMKRFSRNPIESKVGIP